VCNGGSEFGCDAGRGLSAGLDLRSRAVAAHMRARRDREDFLAEVELLLKGMGASERREVCAGPAA